MMRQFQKSRNVIAEIDTLITFRTVSDELKCANISLFCLILNFNFFNI